MEFYILEEIETQCYRKARQNIVSANISPAEDSPYDLVEELLGENKEVGLAFILYPCTFSWLGLQRLLQLNPRKDLNKILTILNAAITND